MARRPWGAGSVYQRSSDGRWVGSVEAKDGSGRRHRRYVTGKDPEVVRRRLRDLARGSTTSRQGGERLDAFLSRWLDDVAAKRLRPRTLQNYRQLADDYIVPAIGGIRLRDLDYGDVQGMLARVHKSPQTVTHVRKVLSGALQQAQRWELVDRNVARLVELPRIARKEPEPWSAQEARRFLKAVREDPLYALYVLALTTGMRRGELLALQWRDYDEKRGTLHVNRTILQVGPKRWMDQEPKTPQSRRTLVLSGSARAALDAHPRVSTEFIFCRPDGRPLPHAETTRAFQRAAVAAGLRKVRFHDMRHTAAVLLLDESGGDLRMVQAMLGHASIAITVDIYGGRATVARERAAALMDRILGEDLDASGGGIQ